MWCGGRGGLGRTGQEGIMEVDQGGEGGEDKPGLGGGQTGSEPLSVAWLDLHGVLRFVSAGAIQVVLLG